MINLRKHLNLFGLWVLQGLFALIWLLLIPTDSDGYSIQRILLMVSLVILLIFFAILAFKMRDVPLGILDRRPWLYNVLYLVGVISFVIPPIVIFTLLKLGQFVGNIYTSYAERLAPLAVLVSLTGLEWCVRQIIVRRVDFSDFRLLLITTLKVFLWFVPLGLIIFATQWGISPIRDGSFGNPSTPLLEWQIILSILAGVTIMLVGANWKVKRLDTMLFIFVYLIACVIWLSDPLVPGYFATPPRAPNFEPYPFSDPLIYAQYSQSALVGEGFLWPDIPTRPFYVTLLTWMYALVGQNYYHVIILQTILLAFFPAVLYLLGREFGSRPLGLMLALLAILRDLTANRAAPFASNYSYSKLFLSELPTALFLVIFTILVIRWMKSSKPIHFFILMGGVLGLASLTRLQSAVLLLPMAVLALIPLWKDRRVEWFKGVIVTTFGFILVISPWFVRNYHVAGGLVVDNPFSQSMTFARRWSGDIGNTIFPQLPGETIAQYVSRMNGMAIDSFKQEPKRILSGVASHFVNGLISSLHTFPVRDRIESPSELLWPSHAFWQADVRFSMLSAFYVLLLVLGLAIAWTTYRWLGLLPFVFSLAYNAWTALFLSSGDRFLIPIDWTWHLYYALGLLALAKVALLGMRDFRFSLLDEALPNNIVTNTFNWKKTAIATGLVLLVGLSLPLTELVFPEKYPPLTSGQLTTTLGITPREDEVIVYGRAIYPRYYNSGEGEPATAKRGYEPNKQARLVFWLEGSDPGLVIFPLDIAPEFFPNAADVWIVGTMDGDALVARVIKAEMDGKMVTYGKRSQKYPAGRIQQDI